MEFQVPIRIEPLPKRISYQDRILLTGSCFTEHIGDRLAELKYHVLQNPNGILFDPYSVSDSLISYVQDRQYGLDDLFYLNETWQSWHHHSRFSSMEPSDCLSLINQSQHKAHEFLKNAHWLIITLGSSFSYRINPGTANEVPVANCHRAPSQLFRKHLMSIDETTHVLKNAIEQLLQFNPALNFIFTVSPVRHLRDGVVENNRSKARLIETVHQLTSQFATAHYFPAYELVVDVLRDYRFYDIDLVHPNYMATEYVMTKFIETCVDQESQKLMEEIEKIVMARKHRAFRPNTNAHRQFLKTHLERTADLKKKYPFLQLDEELNYFQQ